MFDTSFPHEYDVELLEEVPGGATPRFYFPGGTHVGGRNGLTVRVTAETGGSWLGMFAFGEVSLKGVSGIYTCPRSGWICVVSRGEGYLVNVQNPKETESIPLIPILGVLPVPSANLLLFHDFTRLLAVGAGGTAWKTPSLSWDGLGELRVVGETVRGKGWDSPGDRWVSFEVELASGKYTGGSSPELVRRNK